MRLAVSIAAWSRDPDATLPPEETTLPSLLEGLGFSVVRAALGELPASLSAALVGLEPADTLLLHVSGVLDGDGAIEVRGADPLPLSIVADLLASKTCGRALVVVEAAYRGEPDAFRAVELVEAVALALSADGAVHTTVIAVHPTSDGGDSATLAFTRLMLEAVPEVVKPNALALIDHAYARAREGQVSGVAASSFALMHGECPFYVAVPDALIPLTPVPSVANPPERGESAVVAAVELPAPAELTPVASAVEATPPPLEAATDPAPGAAVAEAPASVARPVAPVPRESTRSFDLVDIASSRPGALSRTLENHVPPPEAPDSLPIALDSASVLDTGSFSAVVAPASLPAETIPSPAPAVSPGAHADPTPLELLDASIAEATAEGNHRLAVALRRDRLPYLATVEGRVDELFEIGRTLVAKLRDLPEAVVTLEEARGLDPWREDVLEALRRAYARLERWTETLEVTLALIKKATDLHERAGLRVAAALLACQHLAEEDYALELLALALGDDPGDEAALDEVVRIRRSRGELVDLERSLAALATCLVDAGLAARAWDVCQRLASVRRDDLGDAVGAVEALAIAKRLPLTELDSRAVLAEQLLALNDDEGAVAELETIVSEAPLQLRAHARLFSVHHRSKNHDRAYLSALVLEELGGADATAREILEAYRLEWGLRARTALDDRGWDRLRASGSDDVIEGVFRATIRAAIVAQLEDKDSRLVLDPMRRQPESSTASIIRCFHWAARALGTPCPALYVLDEVKGGIAAVSAPEPTTALGPEVTHGLSSRTLAFLAGRHLTYFRPEHQVLVHFPTAEAAAGLFFAAVDLVAPSTFVPPDLAPRVASAKARLARYLSPEELAALSLAVGRMEYRETKVDLIGWIRSIELTAGRAGLLLAGDLQTALAQVRSEPRGLSGLTVEERRTDLLTFCASRALADLRASYADTASMRPPSSESAVVRREDLRQRESGDVGSAPRLMA